jgi:hypothetical protein
MSDTTAFVGGAVCAGLVVLFLMKGGTAGTTVMPAVQPLPAPSIMPTVIVPSSPTLDSVNPYSLEQQKTNDKLNALLENQRDEAEKLKAQIRNQQAVIDGLNLQVKASASTMQMQQSYAPARAVTNEQATNQLLTGMLWMLGGVTMTITGGAVMVGLLALMSRQQQRTSRTVEVMPPYPANPYLSQRYYTEYLPPLRRVEGKRVNPME